MVKANKGAVAAWVERLCTATVAPKASDCGTTELPALCTIDSHLILAEMAGFLAPAAMTGESAAPPTAIGIHTPFGIAIGTIVDGQPGQITDIPIRTLRSDSLASGAIANESSLRGRTAEFRPWLWGSGRHHRGLPVGDRQVSGDGGKMPKEDSCFSDLCHP